MAPFRLFPTRNPSARAAAHRAMARSALFADSSASTRLKRYNSHMAKARVLEQQAGVPVFVVWLARSGTRLEIHAPTWQAALRRTGRTDACLVEQAGERELTITFGDPDCPQIIDFRTRYATPAETLRGALDIVLHQLDARASDQEVLS